MFNSKFHVLNTVNWYKDIISNLYFKTQHFLCYTCTLPQKHLKSWKKTWGYEHTLCGDLIEDSIQDDKFHKRSLGTQMSPN